MLGAEKTVTWRRPTQDVSLYPGFSSPVVQTLTQKAQQSAAAEAGPIRQEAQVAQIYEKAFGKKASTPAEAIRQMRLYADAVRMYNLPDLPGVSLYAPHANLPNHWGAPWSLVREMLFPAIYKKAATETIKAKKYGYIPRFFPRIESSPGGYQVFAFLFQDLAFPPEGSPRMKAESLVERIKKVEEYATSVPTDIFDFESYNAAVVAWAKDFSVGTQTFNRRVDNLILMLKAWNGVPWPHQYFASFLPAPRVGVPAFVGQFPFYDPGIALSSYFPTTVDEIQKDIATYLVITEEQWTTHFDILLNEKIKKLERKIKRQEKAAQVFGYYFLIMSLIGMSVAAPVAFMLVVNTIPKLAFNYLALRDLTKTQRKAANEIFSLLEFTQENLDTLRLWIAERAELKPVLPPAPGGEGKYALWLEGQFIGRSDEIAELVEYALAAGKIGDKVELGDEELQETAGVGVITKEGIEWMPESLAGKFQNLTGSDRKDIAGALTGKRGEIPWWLIGVPLVVAVAAT